MSNKIDKEKVRTTFAYVGVSGLVLLVVLLGIGLIYESSGENIGITALTVGVTLVVIFGVWGIANL